MSRSPEQDLAETCLPNNLLKLSRYVAQKNIARKDLEVIREIGEFGENIVVSSKGDNVEILAVLSPDEWEQWNKLGQRYLYAQLSLYIQRIWPQIEDDFKARFFQNIQKERKYLPLFLTNTDNLAIPIYCKFKMQVNER